MSETLKSVDRWLLEQALNSLDDLFYAFSLEGDPLYWNDRVTDVTGYTDDEIAEMAPTDFFPPEHQDEIADAVHQALEIGDVSVEAQILTKTGERIPYEFTGDRLTDPTDELIGFTGIGRDITKRKQRERDLREQTRQFRGVLDSVEAAIWIRDLDSRFVLVNQTTREVLGIDPDRDLDGVHPREVLPEPIADQFVANDQRALEQEAPIEFEEAVNTTEGTGTFLTRITPLFTDGDPYATCGVATDITDLKRSQRELERVNEQLDEFVSVASHDLRNPLGVASGRLELARETGDLEHLEAVEQALDRMEALIEDLLTLARDGERVSEMESVALADMTEACWELADTQDASLTIETNHEVRADASRLQQLLENLIRNAADHGGEDVTITVGSLADGFFVEDDGPGIPPEDREVVFEAGYSSSTGTGFGLHIVKQIADAHGWTIQISEGRDGGARFEVTGVDVTG